MITLIRLFAALSFFLFVQLPALAIDGASLEFASGNKTQIGRVGLQWKWKTQWFSEGSTYLGAYWDASWAQWRANQFQNIPDNMQRFNDALLPIGATYWVKLAQAYLRF